VLEHAADAVLVVDTDGVVRAWNPAAERLFGWRQDEAIGRDVGALISPRHLRSARLSHLIREVLSGRQAPDAAVAARAVHRDGAELSVEVNLGRADTAEGTRLIATIRDVTTRQLPDPSRGDATAPSAVFLGEVGSWEWSIGEERAVWSRGLCRIFGCEPGFSPTLAEYLVFIHPDDRERIERGLAGIQADDEVVVGFRIARPDGQVRHLHTHRRSHPDADGRLVRMSGTVLDLTELHLELEALLASRELFGTAFADAPFGIALVALDGRFITVNAALCEITGWSEADLLQRTFGGITHPDDVAGTLGSIERLLRGEARTYQMEMRYLKPSGEQIWVTLSVSLVRDAQGNPRHFVAHAIDLTTAKQVEAALAASEATMRSIFERVPFGLSLRGLDGRYLHVNAWSARVLDIPPAAFIGRRPEDLLTPEQAHCTTKDDARILRTGEPITEELTIVVHDEPRDFNLIKFPILGGDGDVSGLGMVVLEITERQQALRELEVERQALDEAQRIAHVGSWSLDVATFEAVWSPQMYRVFGRDPARGPAVGEEAMSYVHPRDRERTEAAFRGMIEGEGPDQLELEFEIVRGDGKVRALHMLAHRDGQRRTFHIGTFQDVTELRRAERQAREERDRTSTIIAAMGEGYVLVVDDAIHTVNDALCRLTGFSRSELVGSRMPFPFHVPELHDEMVRIRDEIALRGSGTFEVPLTRKDGHRFDAEITARSAFDDEGRMLGLVNTIRDVSARKRQQEELEWLARTDSLTGLANRRVLVEELARETKLARRHHRPLSLILLDIDHFKDINDEHGHPTGDAVLVEIARRLGATVRSGETLARVGGEEFAWLLPGAESDAAIIVAERARHTIEEVPFDAVGRLTMSAGVSTVVGGDGLERIYSAADGALYEAKQAGRNRTVFRDVGDTANGSSDGIR
jgi:diguanylate cyclase (GGDEF)-like protein/PAS domain S-box-containing protein